MSLKYTRAVAKAPGLSAKAGNVLRKLADMADAKGRCFPRQETLAYELSVSERTVRAALKELESMCWITREKRHRRDGSRTSDLITVRDQVEALRAAEAMLRLPLMVAIRGGAAVDKTGENSQSNRQNLPVVQPAKSAGYKEEPTTSKDSINRPPGDADHAAALADLAALLRRTG